MTSLACAGFFQRTWTLPRAPASCSSVRHILSCLQRNCLRCLCAGTGVSWPSLECIFDTGCACFPESAFVHTFSARTRRAQCRGCCRRQLRHNPERTTTWINVVTSVKGLLKCHRDFTRSKYSHERFVVLAGSVHETVEFFRSVAQIDVAGTCLLS